MRVQGSRPSSLLIAGVTVALVGVILAAAYLSQKNRAEKEVQAKEAMQVVNLGIDQFRQKQYRQSLETLGGISEDAYQDWHVNYYMGSSLIMLNEHELAAVELEKALLLNAEEPVILYALGVVYYKLGNLSLSRAYFGKVLEYDPGNEDARGLLDIVANLERRQQENGSKQ